MHSRTYWDKFIPASSLIEYPRQGLDRSNRSRYSAGRSKSILSRASNYDFITFEAISGTDNAMVNLWREMVKGNCQLVDSLWFMFYVIYIPIFGYRFVCFVNECSQNGLMDFDKCRMIRLDRASDIKYRKNCVRIE